MTEKRILVVDNEKDHLELMRQILAKMGYQVVVAEDARTAVALVSTQPIPVVITDLIMPDVEGPELCETIKSIRAQTVVLAFSGHIGLFDPDRLQRAGFDGCIAKPIRIEEVEHAVAGAFALAERR